MDQLRIALVNDLRQLATLEEVSDAAVNGLAVEGLRGAKAAAMSLCMSRDSFPSPRDAASVKTHAVHQQVSQQWGNTTVSEVVDVIDFTLEHLCDQLQQVANDGQVVIDTQNQAIGLGLSLRLIRKRPTLPRL